MPAPGSLTVLIVLCNIDHLYAFFCYYFFSFLPSHSKPGYQCQHNVKKKKNNQRNQTQTNKTFLWNWDSSIETWRGKQSEKQRAGKERLMCGFCFICPLFLVTEQSSSVTRNYYQVLRHFTYYLDMSAVSLCSQNFIDASQQSTLQPQVSETVGLEPHQSAVQDHVRNLFLHKNSVTIYFSSELF